MGETQNITLSIPKKLAAEMKTHKRVRWSQVASEAIEEEVERQKGLDLLETMDRLLAKSKLTEKDVDAIGHKVKQGILKRFKDAANR